MRLLLARHGQTGANAEGVLDTVLPGRELTDEGHRQAAALAEQLAGEPVAAVHASRAVRAQQTARPVAARHGLAVEVLDGVHEVWLGDLDQRAEPAAHERFHAVYRRWQLGDLGPAMPGGENGWAVLARYLPAVAALRAAHHGTDATVVLVSHGAAIRLTAATLAGNVDGAFADQHWLPNCHTVLLEPDGPGWRCPRWADTDLLD